MNENDVKSDGAAGNGKDFVKEGHNLPASPPLSISESSSLSGNENNTECKTPPMNFVMKNVFNSAPQPYNVKNLSFVSDSIQNCSPPSSPFQVTGSSQPISTAPTPNQIHEDINETVDNRSTTTANDTLSVQYEPGGYYYFYICPYDGCSYRSIERHNLTRHYKTNHAVYACRICSQSITGQKATVEHVEKVHNSEDTRYRTKDLCRKFPHQLEPLNRAAKQINRVLMKQDGRPNAKNKQRKRIPSNAATPISLMNGGGGCLTNGLTSPLSTPASHLGGNLLLVSPTTSSSSISNTTAALISPFSNKFSGDLKPSTDPASTNQTKPILLQDGTMFTPQSLGNHHPTPLHVLLDQSSVIRQMETQNANKSHINSPMTNNTVCSSISLDKFPSQSLTNLHLPELPNTESGRLQTPSSGLQQSVRTYSTVTNTASEESSCHPSPNSSSAFATDDNIDSMTGTSKTENSGNNFKKSKKNKLSFEKRDSSSVGNRHRRRKNTASHLDPSSSSMQTYNHFEGSTPPPHQYTELNHLFANKSTSSTLLLVDTWQNYLDVHHAKRRMERNFIKSKLQMYNSSLFAIDNETMFDKCLVKAISAASSSSSSNNNNNTSMSASASSSSNLMNDGTSGIRQFMMSGQRIQQQQLPLSGSVVNSHRPNIM